MNSEMSKLQGRVWRVLGLKASVPLDVVCGCGHQLEAL